jgi:hypothetical protein
MRYSGIERIKTVKKNVQGALRAKVGVTDGNQISGIACSL